ncbi:hypothetical protein D9757_002327 [Collybiopsis confluens]|uniref:Transcription factor domain-containing protein n=1 Tax=Collybiopsis confluens TaxID=2823264 RepID=A0A8H5HZR7_9AGAR|nr:hypothetical protein D9757_002327 [Collybiopsis confluens]
MGSLENNVTRLQARIYELEHPDPSMVGDSPVFLAHPYRNFGGNPSTYDEPERAIIVLDKFLEYGSNFGFFLCPSDFRSSTLLPYRMGHHERPSSSLLATVYFLGLFFSENLAWKSLLQTYLAQALEYVSNGLSGTHPQKVLHTIQSEVLLSNYFFSAGKLLEGRYHIATALSLCIGSNLNKIHSPEILSLVGSGNALFPQAGSSIEIGERITAWWVTLALDQCWAAAIEVNSYNDAIIAESETPWPLPLEEYKELSHQLSRCSNLLMVSRLNFLVPRDHNSVPPIGRCAPLELFSKASLLWKQADLIKRVAAAGLDRSSDFEATEKQIIELLIHLANDRNQASSHTQNLTLLLAQCIAHAALIYLNSPIFNASGPVAQEKLSSSCLAILEAVESIDSQLRYPNPILFMLWALATRTILNLLQIVSNMDYWQCNGLSLGPSLLVEWYFIESTVLPPHPMLGKEIHKVRATIEDLFPDILRQKDV